MLSTNFTSPFLSFGSGELSSGEVVASRRRKRSQNKLDATAVRQIRAQGAGTLSLNIEQLGKKYGVSVSTIKAVLNRKTWKEVK
jgi:DNA invertase Pin-like site-specific DNA recombinase